MKTAFPADRTGCACMHLRSVVGDRGRHRRSQVADRSVLSGAFSVGGDYTANRPVGRVLARQMATGDRRQDPGAAAAAG